MSLELLLKNYLVTSGIISTVVTFLIVVYNLLFGYSDSDSDSDSGENEYQFPIYIKYIFLWLLLFGVCAAVIYLNYNYLPKRYLIDDAQKIVNIPLSEFRKLNTEN